jgi:hypothetical protein
MALALAGIASCSNASGTSGLTQQGGGTPSGTYPITVTATSAGVSHSARITLIVN